MGRFHKLLLTGSIVLAVTMSLAGVAKAFSPVGIFGGLVPKDSGVSVVSGIEYGPDARHRLDVYRPRAQSSGLPVLYFSYGGGWESGEKADYAFVGKAFAAKGYVVVVADYRLVPDVVYPDFVADQALAIDWVRSDISRFGGDPDRIALMGHSAGAYNIMMAAMVPEFGIDRDSIKAIIGLSGPYDFYPFDVPQSVNAFGAYPQPEQTQPVNLGPPDMPPVFLGHGDKDGTVYLRNSVALAENLTAAGNRVTFKVYEGANHADTLTSLSLPLRWRFPVYEDVLQFLDAALQPR